MEGLRNDLDKSLKSHMQQQTSQMDNRFNELRDMFKHMQHPKRKVPAEQEDEVVDYRLWLSKG